MFGIGLRIDGSVWFDGFVWFRYQII